MYKVKLRPYPYSPEKATPFSKNEDPVPEKFALYSPKSQA
jgi:hypothetical protein